MAEELPIEGAPPRYTITLPESATPDEVAAANARANQSDAPPPAEPAASDPSEPPQAAEESTPAPDRRNRRAEKRIHGLNAALKEANEQIAALQAQLGRTTQTQPEPVPERPAPPHIDDYDSTEDYIEARISYEREQMREEMTQTYQQERTRETQEAEQAEQQRAQQTREERIQASLEKTYLAHEDFEEAFADIPEPLSPTAAQLIYEFDDPYGIAYYLAKHPAEVTRINALDAPRIVAAMVAIEDQLQANGSEPAPTPDTEPAPEAPVRQASPEPIRGSTETTATSGNPFLAKGSVDVMAMNNYVENQRKTRGVG